MVMVPHTVNESIPIHDTTSDDDDVTRSGICISIHPITRDRWTALQDAASAHGIDRSELLREAIIYLLDLRDNGNHVVYPAAPKLRPEDKPGIRPRTVWLAPDLFERFRLRCLEDRVAQSEFVLEALHRYLKHRGIEIDAAI